MGRVFFLQVNSFCIENSESILGRPSGVSGNHLIDRAGGYRKEIAAVPDEGENIPWN
jgi:hypothetical protein